MNKGQGELLKWLQDGTIQTVAIDADDTLWFDSRYFQKLKQVFNELAKEETQHDLDLKQITTSIAGEKGYATALLTFAAEHKFSEERIKKLEQEITLFENHPIEILPFACLTLNLMNSYQKILITKGNESEQRRKLKSANLSIFFDDILIVKKKKTDQILEIFLKMGIEIKSTLFIGNSVQHDILPATENGAYAIWLNHPENLTGRNSPLPKGVVEVSGWEQIYEAFATLKARQQT